MIDLNELSEALRYDEDEFYCAPAIIAEAARLYLASQSKPADGVEGDDTLAEIALVELINRAYNNNKNLSDQDELLEWEQTIRHALQSTAKLRAQVEVLREIVSKAKYFYNLCEKDFGNPDDFNGDDGPVAYPDTAVTFKSMRELKFALLGEC